VRLYQSAIDVLSPVDDPQTVHQAKFSMGTVLGLIAIFRRAGVREFEASFSDPRVVALRKKVLMEFDSELDALYPQYWGAKITVETADGRTLHSRCDEPKGDPGNTLTRVELEEKALELAQYSGAATPLEMKEIFARIYDLESTGKIEPFLAVPSHALR
jgi:2-methylcitrate dehydratase PrpD